MNKVTYRVYYEDTDAAGIVYYANYLKFAERARTEWLRELGVEQSHLLQTQGIGFVVKRCEIDYHQPARLDDMITVQTTLKEATKTRLFLNQVIIKDGALLASLEVVIACINASEKATRMPASLLLLLQENEGCSM